MIRSWNVIARSRWSQISPRIWPVIKHIRLMLALGSFMLVFTIVSQILSHGQDYWPFLVHRWGWDLTTVQQGRIYFAWTGLFFATAPQNFYGVLLLLLITMGFLEYRHSTRLAALGFFVIGSIASIITLMLLWPLSSARVTYVRVALYTPDMGASTACFVCLGMLLMNEKGRLRNILLFGVLIILAGLVFRNTPYNIDLLTDMLVDWPGAFFLGGNTKNESVSFRQVHNHSRIII